MVILGAIADRIAPVDENGSRGAADVIMGAAGASLGAAVGIEAARAIGRQMADVGQSMRDGGDAVAAASERTNTPAPAIAEGTPALPAR